MTTRQPDNTDENFCHGRRSARTTTALLGLGPLKRGSMSKQTIDVDTLVHAAVNAARNWDQVSDVIDLIGRMVPHLVENGVDVTCDERSYRPLSLQSWGRLVQERGLLDEVKEGD